MTDPTTTIAPETIRFDVNRMDGEERELWTNNAAGEPVLVGWIAEGRKMVDSRGPWTEWSFEPVVGDMGPVRRSISEAYTDARTYAAQLLSGAVTP